MTQRLGGTICSAASWPMAFCGSAVTRASKSCFGSALNLKGEPPSDADIAAVLQQISRQVIRTLRYLGYLEAGSTDAVTTGYDPLRSEAPESTRPPWAKRCTTTGASPSNASSRSNTDGDNAMARAMATIFFCPPLK